MIEIKYGPDGSGIIFIRVKHIFAMDTLNHKIYVKKKSDLLSITKVTNFEEVLTEFKKQK